MALSAERLADKGTKFDTKDCTRAGGEHGVTFKVDYAAKSYTISTYCDVCGAKSKGVKYDKDTNDVIGDGT